MAESFASTRKLRWLRLSLEPGAAVAGSMTYRALGDLGWV